jgi:hypothetical protein
MPSDVHLVQRCGTPQGLDVIVCLIAATSAGFPYTGHFSFSAAVAGVCKVRVIINDQRMYAVKLMAFDRKANAGEFRQKVPADMKSSP